MTKPSLPQGPVFCQGRLVAQDIHLRRGDPRAGEPKVVATVACARRETDVPVEGCGRCVHFARIETHEAGYVMLCRTDAPGAEAAAENAGPADRGERCEEDG